MGVMVAVCLWVGLRGFLCRCLVVLTFAKNCGTGKSGFFLGLGLKTWAASPLFVCLVRLQGGGGKRISYPCPDHA
jgi:hypothetical protein